MKHRPWRFTLMSLTSCLLVLSASADDFNLVRVLVPSAFAQTPLGAFPEDDENSDFIQSDESNARGPEAPQQRGRGTLVGWSLRAACAAHRDPLSLCTLTSSQDGQPAAGIVRTPLRC
jgi:hypothetical protein